MNLNLLKKVSSVLILSLLIPFSAKADIIDDCIDILQQVGYEYSQAQEICLRHQTPSYPNEICARAARRHGYSEWEIQNNCQATDSQGYGRCVRIALRHGLGLRRAGSGCNANSNVGYAMCIRSGMSRGINLRDCNRACRPSGDRQYGHCVERRMNQGLNLRDASRGC